MGCELINTCKFTHFSVKEFLNLATFDPRWLSCIILDASQTRVRRQLDHPTSQSLRSNPKEKKLRRSRIRGHSLAEATGGAASLTC